MQTQALTEATKAAHLWFYTNFPCGIPSIILEYLKREGQYMVRQPDGPYNCRYICIDNNEVLYYHYPPSNDVFCKWTYGSYDLLLERKNTFIEAMTISQHLYHIVETDTAQLKWCKSYSRLNGNLKYSFGLRTNIATVIDVSAYSRGEYVIIYSLLKNGRCILECRYTCTGEPYWFKDIDMSAPSRNSLDPQTVRDETRLIVTNDACFCFRLIPDHSPLIHAFRTTKICSQPSNIHTTIFDRSDHWSVYYMQAGTNYLIGFRIPKPIAAKSFVSVIYSIHKEDTFSVYGTNPIA